jgi:PIN domain nuclease of toxin-antitoxin system
MRLLVDTHALIWSLENAAQLKSNVLGALNDASNEKVISVASFWEMTIKVSLGKLEMDESPDALMERFEKNSLASILPVRARHLGVLRELPQHHRDPFDRLIVAQAIAEDLTLVSSDANLDGYGVRRLW